jgi:signal transduction histidine kinase
VTTILVVDDRDEDRELLATVLGYAGYEVVEATNGGDALAQLRSAQPALMITDLLMPTMNGYELVRRVRADTELSSTPVVFYTATYLEGEVRHLAEACGVHRFIPKPSDPQKILQIVNEALGEDQRLVIRPDAADFNREQLRVINDKLVEKVNELERVNAERQRLVVHLLNAHEEERELIANGLHDDSVQSVSVVAMRLDMLARTIEDPEQREALEKLREAVLGSIERLRAMIFELQPASLHDYGLAVALRVYLEEAARDGGTTFELEEDDWQEPGESEQSLLYRLVQEAVVNVRKHAGASRAKVTLHARDGVFGARVEDDGAGFDAEAALRSRPGHLGLASMQDRLQLIGGSLRIESAPSRGSVVEMSVPMVQNGGG